MRKQIVLGMVLLASLLVGTAWANVSLNEQLLQAAFAGDKAKAEALIAKGAEVNPGHPNQDTPLDAAAESGNRELVELLIAKGADVNSRGFAGSSPLHTAVIKRHIDVAADLIAHGANVNALNDSHDSPLSLAVDFGLLDVAEILIAHGADLNFTTGGPYPKTLLQLAAESCYGCDAKTKQAMVAFLQEKIAKQGQIVKQSNPPQLLNSLLMQFKGQSDNATLRKSIIDLASQLKPAPPIPPEAEAAAGRGAYIFKNATSADDKLSAAKEYLTAIDLAPWVANYYYNLCTVLEKSPYKQQALHACKLYLVAAPNAADAGDMQQHIAGLQYAADRDKAQMRQRNVYIKSRGVDDLYRFGGISGEVSGKDIVLKLFVDWTAAPPKYQIYVGCLQSDGPYGATHDMVTTDISMQLCHPAISMHLVIRPEGEGFIEVSDTSGSSIRTTLNQLFKAKQQTMAQAVMLSSDSTEGQQFFITYEQGGSDLKHAGYLMYQSDCNGSMVKSDPRALPDDFVSGVTTMGNGRLGKYGVEWNFVLGPMTDMCAKQFTSKTGYHFGETE